jgi:ribose/xylose/arabinose/galactoside ABC-type transport system permease subunit
VLSATPVSPALATVRAPRRAFRLNQAIVIWFVLVLLVVVAAAMSPAFLRSRNLLNVLRQAATLGVISVGQTMVVLSGGADLSQATVMTLSAVVAFKYLGGNDAMIAPVILLCLALGALIGAGNGVMVSKVKVPPFLMTLGTRTIVFGLSLMFTKGAPQGHTTPLFRAVLGQTYVLGIPGQVLIWAAVVFLGWVVLTQTVFGRKLYAVGANARAARLAGVRTDRVLILAYLISGVLAALGGLVLGARSGNADNVMGNGYELNAIAAVVIGGTSFAGGRGGVLGTVGGVLMMTVLQNLLNILGVSPYAYLIAMGIVIIAAVATVKQA